MNAAAVIEAARHIETARRLLRMARVGMLAGAPEALAVYDSPESWAFYRLGNTLEALAEATREIDLATSGNPRGKP